MSKWYGNLQNRMMEQMVTGQPKVEVGMGATILAYSDRHAATIVEWDEKSRIAIVQLDKATLDNKDGKGIYGSQNYTFERDENGTKYTYRQSKEGYWHEVYKNAKTGRWKKLDGKGLRIGDRDHYYDPSF